MKKNYSLVLIALLCAVLSGYGQIYSENFTGQDGKGAIGPNPPTIDLTSVTWSIDISSANLSTTTDWFRVRNQIFEARDIDGDAIWYSPSINIAGFSNVQFSLEASEFGTQEASDILNTEYRIDGGTWNSATTNGNLNDDFTSATVSQVGLNGTNLELRVTMNNGAGTEYHRIDNVLVTGTPSGPNITATPTTINNLDYVLGAGPSASQSFDVTGDLLVAGTTITSNSTNFQVSLTAVGGYANAVNVPAGTLNGTTTIYARLIAGLPVNTYNNTISITNTTPEIGTTPTINVSGEVTSVGGGNCSELMISEYVEGSSNNKYIEIYNPTSGTINLSSYQLALYANGSATPSEFNLSGNLNSFGTLVISNSAAIIYGGASTNNNTVTGFNGNDAVALRTTSGTVLDVVGTIGSNATFGQNTTLRRKSTVQNPNNNYTIGEWDTFPQDTVSDLGMHTSDCEGPTPELQLVDNTATNQNCGYTINFGTQEVSTNTDLTFDIDNVGSADLDITSFNITGDYIIVSPATPFTVTAGNSQTVTVRFTPTTDGILSSILTIINDDLDEGSCIVNLTGEGFTPSPNIIVRGVTGSNPTIANGSTSTSGLNNTLFAQQTINTTQQVKSYRIGNEGGTADLTVSNITLTGDTADFFVTSSFTNPFAANSSQDFTITFQPTTLSGFRSVTVSIANSDINKDPYTFVVGGTANCPSVNGTISPAEGPAGTTVTILSPGNDLTGATATLNGVALNIISDTTTELVVRLPNTITVGGPLSVQLISGCIFSNTFTLLNQTISGCEASTSATVSNLFISEVTDSPGGSLSYVELFNATGATINFASTNYNLTVYNNGNTTTPRTLLLNSGSVANNSTYVISMGVQPTSSQCGVTGGNGSLAQIEQTNIGTSINFFREVSGTDNPNLGHDFIGLYDTSLITSTASDGLIDTWGTLGDETWATGLDLGLKGVNFQRENSSLIPNDSGIFIASAWIVTDWSDADCSDVDYSTIGAYDFSTGLAPTVTLQPIDPSFACDLSASITVAGVEGFDEPSDTQDLEYRWFVNIPGSTTWDEILPANTNYTGQQTVTLNIIDTSNLNENQYYCQIREDDATCYVATNAVILDVRKSVWDGTDWSFPPAIDRIAIIDGAYNSSIGGPNGQTSFQACQLIVNDSYTLTIANNTFVEVQNNLIVNGNIIVQTAGSFVQNNDSATVSGLVLTDKIKITVDKTTAPLATYQEYTYWSSPVVGETIEDGLDEASDVRRFWFNAINYLDETVETNNNDATLNGQDDIDDDGNDWTFAPATSTMLPGVGYASTHNSIGFINPNVGYDYSFQGAFNTGEILVPIYRNDLELNDNNWNFIGNPYPSAIDADLFLMENTSIDQTVGATNGAIFFWSHDTPADGSTNGNENLNYTQSDYAIINGTGQTAGGDGVVPTRHIPSAQGFFVSMTNASSSMSAGGAIRTTNIVFNNSMRVTGNNNQFFRTSNTSTFNKIRLDLTSDNGVFNQILVGYVDGATNNDDGMYYDATRNLASNASSLIYSLIDSNSDKKFAIQGKETNSLTLDEVIPLGFYTSIDEATLYTLSIAELEGDFMNNNTIYLKDNLMTITHDLSLNDYSFTSEIGEFNNRFEIVFQPEALSVNENVLSPNDVSIVELGNGDVKISVGKNMIIDTVDILDVLGRTIYKLKGQNSTETYNLSQLSQATYLARITLSNGQVITKKAVKRF